MYFLREQYSRNLTEVTSAKNADGLSGMDKMEMNLQKLDEGLIIFAEVDIKTEIARIMRDNDFGITEEEIQYYIRNHKLTKLQVELVFAYWSKYFGSARSMALINRREYIILLLILKKKLLLQAGYNTDDKFAESTKLPYLLTGNVQDKINTRLIRNNKYVSKLEESDIFKNLKRNKYYNLSIIRQDYLLSILSQVINTTFTYVIYEDDSMLGKEIEFNEDKISDELIFLFHTI